MQAVWFVSVAVPLLFPRRKNKTIFAGCLRCLGLFYYISNQYWYDVTSTLFTRCTHLLCIATINFYRLFCHVRRDWGKPFARRRPRSERTLRSGRDEARLAGLIRAMPRRDNSGGAGNRPRRRRMPAVFGFGAGEAAVCFPVVIFHDCCDKSQLLRQSVRVPATAVADWGREVGRTTRDNVGSGFAKAPR